MKNLRIAEELIEAAKDLIFADNDYIYDPDHKKHPSGGYHKTEKGWSKVEEKKEKTTSKVEMTYEQKILENKLYGVDLYTLQNMYRMLHNILTGRQYEYIAIEC